MLEKLREQQERDEDRRELPDLEMEEEEGTWREAQELYGQLFLHLEEFDPPPPSATAGRGGSTRVPRGMGLCGKNIPGPGGCLILGSLKEAGFIS